MKNKTIYFAHAHCCSKSIIHCKTNVAIDLEFAAKGKRNNKRNLETKTIYMIILNLLDTYINA
jgi:hypothetical protein